MHKWNKLFSNWFRKYLYRLCLQQWIQRCWHYHKLPCFRSCGTNQYLFDYLKNKILGMRYPELYLNTTNSNCLSTADAHLCGLGNFAAFQRRNCLGKMLLALHFAHVQQLPELETG